jgi:poly-gamma-glutamate capsule biosynthesis protein CapA/YwtB (metallophosphatase superfamily)
LAGRSRLAALVAVGAGLLLPLLATAAGADAGAAAATRHRPPVRLSAVGDTILGNTPVLPPHARLWFHDVRGPIRRGTNIRFANLEGTLTNETQNKCGSSLGSTCFAFRNPPSYAGIFANRGGFTVLNNANNHSLDFGRAGLADTRQAIAAAGMKHTGMPGEITYTRAGGVRVAVIGFAPYPWTASLLDLDAAAALVHTARQHASVVVVYMHAGAEGSDKQHVTGQEEYYLGEDRGNPERFAHRVVRAGADLVIASGPHVLRGMEFYRHRLIAYSLGNFASYKNFNTTGVCGSSAVLRVSLGPFGGFRSGRLVAVTLDGVGHPSLGGDSVGIVRQLSKADFGAAAARLTRRGFISAP